MANLSQKLVSQRKEVGKVERDEQRMGALVDRLNKLIEEQARAAAAEAKRKELLAAARAKAKAEAEARAKARAEELRLAQAKARAERERLAQQNRGKTPTEPRVVKEPEPKPAPQIAQQEKPVKPEPRDEGAARPADVALAPAAPAGAFASLKGQMRAPLAGKVAAKFGSKRGDGPSWKGVFILAGEGTEIRSVAQGRVVFADWLRGFGNLIIVDHGGQYMSIYGNNQSLLRRVGDVVKGGDVIAAAGNSGGNEESGLYFELRHQGRAFDPAGWVKF